MGKHVDKDRPVINWTTRIWIGGDAHEMHGVEWRWGSKKHSSAWVDCGKIPEENKNA